LRAEELIKNFHSSSELDKELAAILIQEFSKAGLILLPVGTTFEKSIYPLVNKHFQERFNDIEKALLSEINIHKDLKISQVDELIAPKNFESFGSRLRKSLSTVVEYIGEGFFQMDIDDFKTFDSFIKSVGGPRLMFLGIGSDPSRTHVAYIGEEYLNRESSIIELSKEEKLKQKVAKAISIGTDIFQAPSLESIIVVAKGLDKAEALKAAFEDEDTGLGYLIKHHPDKLKIYADAEALVLVKRALIN
jgi:6-phosphogluconolactonase/glucosamine-6-phosphate isomerase/deaminase